MRRAGGRGGQGDVQLAAQDGERRAQLVRGVGAELPRRRERPLEASQHVVQHGGEPAELVVRRVGGESPRQVLGADAPRRLHHGVDRRERPTGEPPAAGRGAQQGQRQQARQHQQKPAAGGVHHLERHRRLHELHGTAGLHDGHREHADGGG